MFELLFPCGLFHLPIARTMFRLHCIFILQAFVFFSSVEGNDSLNVSTELPLETAITTALEHNLGLVISSYRPINAQDEIIAEEAQFALEFFGTASLGERESAAASSSLDSVATPKSETRRAGLGVEKRLATGAIVTVDSGLNRSTSNNNSARNPDYSSDLGVSIRQPLMKDAWTEVNLAPLARARVTAERSVFEWRSDLLDLILETEIAYWSLAYRQADRALIASSLELAENLLEENIERERLGLVTPLEVLQAEAEVLNQHEDIIQADRAIQDAVDALLRVLGEADFLQAYNGSFTVAPLPDTFLPLRSVELVVQDAVTSDVEAKAQERAIEVERINKILALDQTRPDLDLAAGVTYLGRDTDGETAYQGAYKADGYNWNIGLEIRLPWSFQEARVRMRQAERNIEKSKWVLADIKQSKAYAARSAWRSASTGLKRIEVSRKSLEINQEAFVQERARYGSGLVAYRSVLEAQRDFDRARSNYLSSLIETIKANVRLSRVDGSILQRHSLAWEMVPPMTKRVDLSK